MMMMMIIIIIIIIIVVVVAVVAVVLEVLVQAHRKKFRSREVCVWGGGRGVADRRELVA